MSVLWEYTCVSNSATTHLVVIHADVMKDTMKMDTTVQVISLLQ